MTIAELLKTVRQRLRETTVDADSLWADDEIIDVYANNARRRLFRHVGKMVIDSTTATDLDALPLCTIPIVAGTATYAISPRILRVLSVKLASNPMPLPMKTTAHLDMEQSQWRRLPGGQPFCWTPDMGTDTLTLIPTPTANDTASLLVSRYPLDDLSINGDPAPDLGFKDEYHEDLIPWILHLCFLKKDANTDRPDLAEYYRKKFYDRCAEIRAELSESNVGRTVNRSTMVI